MAKTRSRTISYGTAFLGAAVRLSWYCASINFVKLPYFDEFTVDPCSSPADLGIRQHLIGCCIPDVLALRLSTFYRALQKKIYKEN